MIERRPPLDAPRPARRVAALVVALATVVGLVSACALPTDDRVVPYNVDEVPDQLTDQTTTTTTTTTTTPVPTTPVPTVPGETTTTTTTTTLPFVPEPITVYYTIGSSDDIRPLQVNRGREPSIQEVVAALESTTGLSQLGLRTTVRPGLISDVMPERGVATIELDSSVLNRMSEAQRRRAIAQMVLTFTSFRPPDQGNIAFVTFETDGGPFVVFVPAFNGMSEPQELLAYADFAELIASGSANVESTTTTTTSTTTTTTTTTPTSTTASELDPVQGPRFAG